MQIKIFFVPRIIAAATVKNMGRKEVKALGDGWTVVTKGHISAQWEHTILVTSSGHEILTMRNEEGGAYHRF